jgi:hypothetical protein
MNDRMMEHAFPGRRAAAERGARSRPSAAIVAAVQIFAGLLVAVPVLVALCASASAEFLVETTKCGAPINSTVKRGIDAQQTINPESTYVNVGAAGLMVNVPVGQTRCVRVRFSAALTCNSPSNISNCYIKVTDSLSPYIWDPAVALATDQYASAHSYEWAARLSAGSHLIRIQAAKNSGVAFTLHHWTLAVDLAK